MPDRPATLRDVAAAARVHPATASRALNPETRILVSEDTARRVTDAAAGSATGRTRSPGACGPGARTRSGC
jgi:Transcriptional regulators